MDKRQRYRVRPAQAGGACVVLHPEHGQHVAPDPRAVYYSDDPLVREYPWLFVVEGSDEDRPHEYPDAVRIEDATARPGARRGARR